MNDFTKDELISILDAFHYAEDSPSWRESEGWDDPLKKKIQAMIENYCEHQNAFRLTSFRLFCPDCGEIW